jgi:hypothetical protein
MGSTSSFHSLQSNDASIQLDNEHVYYPGDCVSGTLQMKHKDEKNEVVSIDLIGEFAFTVALNSVFTQNAADYDYHLPFFKVSTLSLKNGEKFSLLLCEDLPPSINLRINTYPCIRYFVQINLIKNKQHRYYIIVCPRVSVPRSIVQSQQFHSSKDEEIYLSGTVDRDWILPGETLHITFQINNPNHKQIKLIKGNIFMKGQFTKADCSEKVTDFIADNVIDTNEEHINGTISINIPSRYFPPTFIYSDDQQNFSMNTSYWILIEIHVTALFNTIHATIPLSMGYEHENIIFDKQFNPQHHHRISFRRHSINNSLKHHRRRHSKS